MYKATGEYISKEEFIQSAIQDKQFLVFPPDSAEQMNARKLGLGRFKRGGQGIGSDQGFGSMQSMQQQSMPQPKLTISDCATTNSVVVFDDEPTMLKAIQLIQTSKTGSTGSTYGLLTEKSIYIPGGGRLDFDISMDNGGPNINSITFYKSSLFPGKQDAVKFTP